MTSKQPRRRDKNEPGHPTKFTSKANSAPDPAALTGPATLPTLPTIPIISTAEELADWIEARGYRARREGEPTYRLHDIDQSLQEAAAQGPYTDGNPDEAVRTLIDGMWEHPYGITHDEEVLGLRLAFTPTLGDEARSKLADHLEDWNFHTNSIITTLALVEPKGT